MTYLHDASSCRCCHAISICTNIYLFTVTKYASMSRSNLLLLLFYCKDPSFYTRKLLLLSLLLLKSISFLFRFISFSLYFSFFVFFFLCFSLNNCLYPSAFHKSVHLCSESKNYLYFYCMYDLLLLCARHHNKHNKYFLLFLYKMCTSIGKSV